MATSAWQGIKTSDFSAIKQQIGLNGIATTINTNPMKDVVGLRDIMKDSIQPMSNTELVKAVAGTFEWLFFMLFVSVLHLAV